MFLRLLGLLLVAAIVVGIGTTANKGWGPDFRGDGAQIGAEEKASRNMLDLARTATALATGTAAGNDSGTSESSAPASAEPSAAATSLAPASARELERAAAMLRGHVELLTPGLAARVAQETADGTSTGASGLVEDTHPAGNSAGSSTAGKPDSPVLGDTGLAEIALGMAGSANDLLESSLAAAPGDVAAVLGAGIEQRLEAQRLAALVPGQPALEEFPKVGVPDATQEWSTAAGSQLPSGSCSADSQPGDSSSGGSQGASASTPAGEPTAAEEATAHAVRAAADAAFRLAYGYQMAAIKQPGASTHRGWDLAATTSALGHTLEDLLPSDCSPTRATAYALPRDFKAHPLASVAGAEEQLAALLRDAAADAPQPLRTALVAEAWRSADRAFELSGTIPELT
ncbi:hypothetical protein [Arthrobacter sp. JSM 101049]|uniref:hypothetical protein n=1 Tax=Arthrobacter sp. JSM 101049 TaxID=929097 RepID=UPI00356740AD